MGTDNHAPLILTLRFDDASFARFDGERRRHFPHGRNLVPAHLTLFHHLPGERLGEIRDVLSALAAGQSAFTLAVSALRFLGQGTAYGIESAELETLRAGLAARWQKDLTRQDAQRFRPHVTIQNKTPAAQAKSLFEALDAEFRRFEAGATGLLLWHYRGGPWDAAGEFRFANGCGHVHNKKGGAGAPPLSGADMTAC